MGVGPTVGFGLGLANRAECGKISPEQAWLRQSQTLCFMSGHGLDPVLGPVLGSGLALGHGLGMGPGLCSGLGLIHGLGPSWFSSLLVWVLLVLVHPCLVLSLSGFLLVRFHPGLGPSWPGSLLVWFPPGLVPS